VDYKVRTKNIITWLNLIGLCVYIRLRRDIRPTNTVLKDNKSWWIYAYKCVLRQRVTLLWNKIKMHR